MFAYCIKDSYSFIATSLHTTTSFWTVLGQLPPRKIASNPNSNANPKRNPNPNPIFLGGNCTDTFWRSTIKLLTF